MQCARVFFKDQGGATVGLGPVSKRPGLASPGDGGGPTCLPFFFGVSWRENEVLSPLISHRPSGTSPEGHQTRRNTEPPQFAVRSHHSSSVAGFMRLAGCRKSLPRPFSTMENLEKATGFQGSQRPHPAADDFIHGLLRPRDDIPHGRCFSVVPIAASCGGRLFHSLLGVREKGC